MSTHTTTPAPQTIELIRRLLEAAHRPEPANDPTICAICGAPLTDTTSSICRADGGVEMSEQVGKIFTRQDVADALQDAFLRFDTCTSADPDQYSFTIEGRHLMIDFIFEHYGIPTDISELEAWQ